MASTQGGGAARRPGRPRSESADRAILDAARELLSERRPREVSMEAIAERAGVGKATLYRRWASREELALALLEELSTGALPVRDMGDTRAELVALIRQTIAVLSGTVMGKGDRLVFDDVRVLGNQDTLLVDSANATTVARSYFVHSYIEGDVDFIFGRGTAVFDRSTIHALSRGSNSNNGYITAASTATTNPHGILITDSTIQSDAPAKTFSLGRPWEGWADKTQAADSRGEVTVRDTVLPAAIRDNAWADMSPLKWTDGRFFEYRNSGPGAAVNDTRPQLTDDQAAQYTAQAYLAGSDGWDPVAG